MTRSIRPDGLWRDVRHAIRSLRRTPGFTAVALAVLTLSIGATTAIFSVVDAVIVRGLPFDESDRLIVVGERNVKSSTSSSLHLAAPQNYLAYWRAAARTAIVVRAASRPKRRAGLPIAWPASSHYTRS